MEKLLTISPSPHVHSGDSIQKNMYGVIIALVPALALSIFYFGIGALAVTSIAVVSCILTEHFIQKYLIKTESTVQDGSAVLTGLLLAFNIPTNLPWWIIVIGSIVAIGVGKMSFGGLGNNVFNPALVGRVFMLISFPAQMTSWPVPVVSRMSYVDAATSATPLSIIKEGLTSGESVSALMEKAPSYLEMFLGHTGGSAGEMAGIALILGMLYMLWRKIITWHIPISILGTVAVFTGLLHLANPDDFVGPLFHILSGGLLLGAIYMATDYVSSPMTKKGQWIYGVGIGVITVVIRVFGAYPEGISFAILIMNGFTPLINMYIKPKRFGEEVMA